MMPHDFERVAEWPSDDIVFCLAGSDDGRRLWLGSSDAGVYELDVSPEKPERVKLTGEGHSSYVTGMARCGNGLVTGGYDRRLIWWDLDSGQQRFAVAAHDKWIRAVAATPDGRRVISVADDMRCRVWDAETGERIADVSDHAEKTPHHYPSMLYTVAVAADGSRIATGDRTGHVAIWDAERWEKIGELAAPVMYTWDPRQRRHSIGGIRSLAFSPDGSKLAVGGMGKVGNIDHLQGPSRLEIFDPESGERLHEIEDEKHKGLIEQIAWAPGGGWILAAGGDHNGFLSTYDTTTGESLQTASQNGHIHAVWHDAAFETLYVAGHRRLSRWGRSQPA